MPTFKYEVVDSNGKHKKGTLESNNIDTATAELNAGGGFIISIGLAGAMEKVIDPNKASILFSVGGIDVTVTAAVVGAIVAILAAFIFTAIMIIVFIRTGAEPSTLIENVFKFLSVEGGAMALIKSVKTMTKKNEKESSEKQQEETTEDNEEVSG